MKTNATPRRGETILVCVVWSLGVAAVIDAEEPWRPETAAAVGRALALAEPAEEEEDFTASLGGVRAGVYPVRAGANMSSGLARTITGLGIASAAMGNADTRYRWARYEDGFFSEISLNRDMDMRVKIMSPQGTTVYDEVRSLREVSQMQRELDNLAGRWHDSARQGYYGLSTDQVFKYEGDRSFAEHSANAVLFVANTMGSLIGASGYDVTGLTISTMAYGATVYKGGGIVLPSATLVFEGTSFVGGAKGLEGTGFARLANALPLVSGVTTTADYIKSTFEEDRRLSNTIGSHSQQINLRLRSIDQWNSVAGACWGTNRGLSELMNDVRASSTSFKDYVQRDAYYQYKKAISPNIDGLTRIESSTKLANAYLDLGSSRLDVMDRTLALYENGMRKLPNTDMWVTKDIESATSYATARLSQARNATEWAGVMGDLERKGLTVARSPYEHGTYAFAPVPTMRSMPLGRMPTCVTNYQTRKVGNDTFLVPKTVCR